jgi:hypothetical protein
VHVHVGAAVATRPIKQLLSVPSALPDDVNWEVSVLLEGPRGAVSDEQVVRHLQYGWPELQGAVRATSDGKAGQTITVLVPPALADGTAIRYAFGTSPTEELDRSDVLQRSGGRTFTRVLADYPEEYYFCYRLARGPRVSPTTSMAVSGLATEVVVEEEEEANLWFEVFMSFPGREEGYGGPYFSTTNSPYTTMLTGVTGPSGSFLLGGGGGKGSKEGTLDLLYYPEWLKWEMENTSSGPTEPTEFTVTPHWTGASEDTGGSIDVTWTGGADRSWSYGTYTASSLPAQMKQFHMAAPYMHYSELEAARNSGYARVGWVFTPYSNVGENPAGIHWFKIGLTIQGDSRVESDGRTTYPWSYQHKRLGMPELSMTLLRREGGSPPCEMMADSNHPESGSATGTNSISGGPATTNTMGSDKAYLAAEDAWLFDTDTVSNGHELTVNFSTSAPYEVFVGRVGAPGDGGINAGKGIVDSTTTYSSYAIGVSLEKHMSSGWETNKLIMDFMLHSSTGGTGDAIGFKQLRPFWAKADGAMSTDTA